MNIPHFLLKIRMYHPAILAKLFYHSNLIEYELSELNKCLTYQGLLIGELRPSK